MEELQTKLEELINKLGRGKLAVMLDNAVRVYHKGLSTEGNDLGVDSVSIEYNQGDLRLITYVEDGVVGLIIYTAYKDSETGLGLDYEDVVELVVTKDYTTLYGKAGIQDHIPKLTLRAENLDSVLLSQANQYLETASQEVLDPINQVKDNLSKYDKLLVIKNL